MTKAWQGILLPLQVIIITLTIVHSQKLDLNKNGVVTLEEFIEACTQASHFIKFSAQKLTGIYLPQDETIIQSFEVFSTLLWSFMRLSTVLTILPTAQSTVPTYGLSLILYCIWDTFQLTVELQTQPNHFRLVNCFYTFHPKCLKYFKGPHRIYSLMVQWGSNPAPPPKSQR